MANDQQTRGGGSQHEAPEDVLHELAEALTALGNYLDAASQISAGADPPGTDIGTVLEAASSQYKLAATAFHRLRSVLMRREASGGQTDC